MTILGCCVDMTERDRILAAVAHEHVDPCPYYVELDEPARARLVQFTGDSSVLEGVRQSLCGLGPHYPNTNNRIDATHYQDDFGVIWHESVQGEIGMAREPLLQEPTCAGFNFPPTRVSGLFDDLPAQLERNADRYTFWSIGFSLFERAWSLRGMEPFLMDMAGEPDFAHELLDTICEFNLDLIEQACACSFDCVRFGDDWGAQRGLIMGPDRWREFIKPRMAQMIAKCHRYGKSVFLHSDGDIRAIIPDLIAIGLDILNPVQPDVMDVYALKREFGKDLTFLGGVSVQKLLPHGSPQQIRAEIRQLIRELGVGGGFVIAPTHALGPDIPPENLLAMIEAFHQQ